MGFFICYRCDRCGKTTAYKDVLNRFKLTEILRQKGGLVTDYTQSNKKAGRGPVPEKTFCPDCAPIIREELKQANSDRMSGWNTG